jgi:probable rRNA maturation factor
MIDLDNRVGCEVDTELLNGIAKKLTCRDVELIIVDDNLMREYNKKFRDKDETTDVISLPLEGGFEFQPLGTIIINYDKVKRVSSELKHSEKDEMTLLFIHGLLHLLGYDHESDNGLMRKYENDIVKELGLPDSLIVRSEG